MNEKSNYELGRAILEDSVDQINVLKEMMNDAKKADDVDSVIKLAAAISRIVRDARIAQYQADQFARLMIGKAQQQQVVEQQAMFEELSKRLGPQADEVLSNIASLSKKLGGRGAPRSVSSDGQEIETDDRSGE